ncbi:cation-translocating P-type ATPase [Candidatus Microgenomates bacterium]|nr:cation-translocating P-type ATPase [Candidatus Microgenomates bacterium]
MQGLAHAEVLVRQKTYGLNILENVKKKSTLFLFLSQFTNLLTVLLLLAAVISFVIGEKLEGVLIVGIVGMNAIFSVYQEKKASDAVNLLKDLSVTITRVIRDGREQEVDSKYIVPGDIIYVEEGSKVIADGKLIEGRNLELNESVLTGESLSVPKEQNEQVFMGTVVSKGRGYVEIQKTGMNTKFGDITRHLTHVSEGKTPLEKKLDDVSKKIGITGIVASALVFILSLFHGSSLTLAFLTGISLAVAVVPEGLPAVLTITLGIGVREMARKKAIVRKMSAIEAIGNVTIIATDKTGTLTTNNMSVKEIYVSGKVFHSERPQIADHPFSKLLLNGMVNSTASLVPVHGKETSEVLGDATEGALLNLAREMKISYETARHEWKLLDESSFDGTTKRMSVIASKDAQTYLLTKGAPESILDICTRLAVADKSTPMTKTHTDEIRRVMDQWAARGYRVIGFSYKEVPRAAGKPIVDQVAEMTFLGLVALHDPPRAEVPEALNRARRAGITVVMVTGDNEKTAESIATEIGLMKPGDEVLTGKQLDDFSDEELLIHLPNTRVFARTTPFHKSLIVSLYQKLGEVVAVTGDGVNDAIALKQADIGIAMGRDGTDVARDTADIVLADDNFASIIDAVEQGRRIIRNFTNSLTYLTTGNFAEGLTLVVGLLLGIHDLFFPIELLYINLMSDGLPAIALAFAPMREHLMKQPPKRELRLFDAHAKRFILTVGLFLTAIILTFYFATHAYLGESVAKTAAFIQLDIAQVFMFVGLWTAQRSIRNYRHYLNPLFPIGFIVPILIQFVINEVPQAAHALHITTLPVGLFMLFIVLSAIPVILYWVSVRVAAAVGGE